MIEILLSRNSDVIWKELEGRMSRNSTVVCKETRTLFVKKFKRCLSRNLDVICKGTRKSIVKKFERCFFFRKSSTNSNVMCVGIRTLLKNPKHYVSRNSNVFAKKIERHLSLNSNVICWGTVCNSLSVSVAWMHIPSQMPHPQNQPWLVWQVCDYPSVPVAV